uniref:Dehydrogenases with different specificities n=1 Tax=Melanopsichium pennsylvanicum 4 TaxID=1398559 RepID=A0A077R505_9BASI|nr:dehydrogenases with different specificities [Melanopsichium pennsylvanicum 4]
MGVVTMSALAHRGAQIIALTPEISSPHVIQIIHLIRDSTQSELIYAEQCDVANLESVSAFAALWNSGDKKQPQGVLMMMINMFKLGPNFGNKKNNKFKTHLKL